jgi:hypothetical protein
MTRPWSLTVAVAAAAFVLSAVGVAPTPASAHDQLLASNPSEGAVVSAAPSEVRLDFSNMVLDLGGIVIVADRNGTNWAAGPLVTGRSVIQKLRDGAPEGAYQIRWQVVSADGHPISGIVNYSVGETAAEPITANPSSGASPTRAPDEQGQEAAPADEKTLLTPLQLYGGLGLGGAAVGVAAFLLISSLVRRRTSAK